MSNEEKLRLYADPEIRAKLHDEAVVNKPESASHLEDLVELYLGQRAGTRKNKWMQFKSIGDIAKSSKSG